MARAGVALAAIATAMALAPAAQAADPWLLTSPMGALRAPILKLPQPIGTAPEVAPAEAAPATKGDRLTSKPPAPIGPIAVLPLVDADPATTGALPPPPAAKPDAAELAATAPTPKTVLPAAPSAPAAVAAPLNRPAPGFVASVPMTDNQPQDLITRGAPGAPGTFPPLVSDLPTIFEVDPARLPAITFEHLTRAPMALKPYDESELPQNSGPAAIIIRRFIAYVSS